MNKDFDPYKDIGSTRLNTMGPWLKAWVIDMGWGNSTNLEKLAMITSEIGEAVNECRGNHQNDNFRLEVADILIRTLVLASSNDIDIEQAITDKMAINRKNGNKGRII